MNNPPNKLYHYCSVESMFNIIKSKSLWLSNSKQMNDAKESAWIENHFDIIRKNFICPDHKNQSSYCIKIYHANKHNPFIFCLSEEPDSLSQWRAYSLNATGVSICLNTEQLDISHQWPWENETKDYSLSVLKVKYNYEAQEKTISQLTERYKNKILNNTETSCQSESIHLALELTDLSMILKNPSFKEEKEWRIIYTPLKNPDSILTDQYPDLSKLKFRTSEHKIISYYELHLNKIFNSKLIPEIILGPKSEIDIPELELFLKANGLEKTKVIKSESSYR